MFLHVEAGIGSHREALRGNGRCQTTLRSECPGGAPVTKVPRVFAGILQRRHCKGQHRGGPLLSRQHAPPLGATDRGAGLHRRRHAVHACAPHLPRRPQPLQRPPQGAAPCKGGNASRLLGAPLDRSTLTIFARLRTAASIPAVSRLLDLALVFS